MLAEPRDLDARAEILNDGKKVAILAGRGALHATAELEQAADILGAPIIKALLGKAAVPDDSPYTTGTTGLLGTRPSQEAMEGCDTLLMIGTSFPYLEFLPKPGDARGVQIECDPRNASGCVFRSTLDWWATAVAYFGNCYPNSGARRTGSFWKQRRREWRNGKKSWKTAPAAPINR